MTIKEELLSIMNTVEGMTYSNVQSTHLLIDYGFKINGWIARTGELQSVVKEALHKARKKAYLSVIGSLSAHQKKMGAMLIKDYINDCCAEENALYELAERTNRACVHSNSLIVTAVSALKEEQKAQAFQTALGNRA